MTNARCFVTRIALLAGPATVLLIQTAGQWRG